MLDSVKSRHAVRSYTDRKIEGETKQELESLISEINVNEKLDFRLVLNEPQAFNSHYGSFKNANNYIVLAGDKSISNLEEKSILSNFSHKKNIWSIFSTCDVLKFVKFKEVKDKQFENI